MIRVLQVLGGLNLGGAETMVMNLYRAIDRTQVQFDFIIHLQGKQAYEDEVLELGGRIYRFPAFNGKNLCEIKELWNHFFVRYPEYKILHSHVRSYASVYLPIAKKHGLTTIIHSHSTSNGSGISSIAKKIMQYPLRYQADYFFGCSKEAGEWLFGDTVVNSDKFTILKNAIDIKKYTYSNKERLIIRNEFKIQESTFVLGHIGRFMEAKNHKFLIDIFKVIHEKYSDSKLMLVGDGKLKKLIKNKVQKLGLQNDVIFTGIRSDIPELLSAMDVFCFPSVFEGLGIVAVEAQASGLHTICSDKVPKEANVTELAEFISLAKSAEEWANIILKYRTYERTDTFSDIYDAGYDIKQTARWLQNFYIEMEK
jgi:glycosyltransferase involved in cell wall biosynthesis